MESFESIIESYVISWIESVNERQIELYGSGIFTKIDGGIVFNKGGEINFIEDWVVVSLFVNNRLDFNNYLNLCSKDNDDFSFHFDMDKMIYDCRFGLMKEGKKYNKMILGYGKKMGYCKVGSYSNSIIGENLKIVEKTFKNLKNDWFKDWKFEVVEKIYYNHFHKEKKGKDRRYWDDIVNVDYGSFLEISNENFGRILLGELDKKKFNDKYDFKVVVKSIERYKGCEKGKMGSVLTILNRVCKGNDILIEIEVGDLNSVEIIENGEINFNQRKLESWYEKRGFKNNNMKSLMGGVRVMDSREILEEYCNRMGWNDE